ncbi:MAG: type II secretion system protein GspM [Deltaproteobacteria bacterium]|nr:type II secretion system protein GspM [Deltaproteobacteria bacterium]
MKKKSKILVVAIPLMIILLGAVIYQYGYLRAQTELTAMEDTRSVKSKTLEKYITLIADKPRIEEKLNALRETRKAENSKMIEGQTPSLAAAALQNTIKVMITARGGTISSERAEKPEDTGKFKMITVTIDAVLPDTRALGDTLYAIETQTPYLVVRELDTRIRNFREPRDLIVKLKVSGLTGGK